MPTSAARIAANQKNAQHSTGPKTPEGKEKSRQNALKHGLTGSGIVLPVEDAAAVDRRYASFCAELEPSGDLGYTLLKRAATLAVRMEKCAEREMATSAERVTRAMVECDVPEGVDDAEATRLRAEAGRLAAFDTSKEARLARSYEAAAERGFFRALKEFRLVEKQAKAAEPADDVESFRQMMGSFLEMRKQDEEFAAAYPELDLADLKNPFDSVLNDHLNRLGAGVDVPCTIGKGR